MSELKDEVAKRYGWRDFDHFESNDDNIPNDYKDAVNDVLRLEKENGALKEKIAEAVPIIKRVYDDDYGSPICNDLFNLLDILEGNS